MREILNNYAVMWKTDRLKGSIVVCWIATVFFSFWGPYILSLPVPGIGELFPFRILLPITAILYILFAIREKEHLWRDASTLERWCYALALIMLLYSAVSLFWALDFSHSFHKFFNLCLDLCFFVLMLRLCRNKRLFCATLYTVAITTLLLAVLGTYEVFFGGIFNNQYASGTSFSVFNSYYQFPIVTSSTCNEYAATLLFLASVVFLFWAKGPTPFTRCKIWMAIFLCPYLLFLINASSARLCRIAFFFFLAGIFIWLLCHGRKFLWISVAILLLLLCEEFVCQYRYIVPPLQQYLTEVKQYQETDPSSTSDPVPEQKPQLQLGNPVSDPLKDQFFVVNEETNEIQLNEYRSAGIRLRLLMHAYDCFKESHGLGVGIGNAEILAQKRADFIGSDDSRVWALHCFIARIIADYGVFVLIPLCIIAFLLLKNTWETFSNAVHRKDYPTAGLSVAFFLILIIFIFGSTASSDAQDLIPMWIYLAAIVLFAVLPTSDLSSTPSLAVNQTISSETV